MQNHTGMDEIMRHLVDAPCGAGREIAALPTESVAGLQYGLTVARSVVPLGHHRHVVQLARPMKSRVHIEYSLQ